MGRKKSETSQAIIEEPKTQVLLNRNYNKPNFLIGAKYKSKLIDNQVIAVAMTEIKNMYHDKDGIPSINIKATDLRDMIGGNDGSFYSTLARAADRMTKRNMGVVDPENGTFEFVSIIIGASFGDGIFKISFNPKLEKQLTSLDKANPYTKLNLKIMLSFTSVYSFRLFELIKAKCFSKKGETIETEGNYSIYHINFILSELMIDLGIINSEDDKVADILRHKKEPDYDKAISVLDKKDKKYSRWSNFRNKVLDVAVEEINAKSHKGMFLEYEPKPCGRGGKIHDVMFTAKINDKLLSDARLKIEDIIAESNTDTDNTVQTLTSEAKEDFIDDLADLIEEKVKPKDLRSIAEAANYNMSFIEDKYKLSKTQDIDRSLVGWLLSAIKNDYSEPVKKATQKKSRTKKNAGWDDIENHQYNFDDLEQQLLDN